MFKTIIVHVAAWSRSNNNLREWGPPGNSHVCWRNPGVGDKQTDFLGTADTICKANILVQQAVWCGYLNEILLFFFTSEYRCGSTSILWRYVRTTPPMSRIRSPENYTSHHSHYVTMEIQFVYKISVKMQHHHFSSCVTRNLFSLY